MNNFENLKQKFATREKIRGTSIMFFNEPLLIEHMKRNDLDFLLFDMEHSRFDSQNIILYLYMYRMFEIPSIVRVPDAEYHLIAKTVDMGADGIMLPRTETLEQLRVAVDAMYFYPIGKKGCGGAGQFRKGESFGDFQGGRYLIPQIESPNGIQNLPDMLETFGERISGIIVGPYDMSVMVGTPRDIYSEETRSAIQKVMDICQAYKKSAGVFCGDVAEAAVYQKMGANIFWLGADLDFFIDGYTRVFDALSDI